MIRYIIRRNTKEDIMAEFLRIQKLYPSTVEWKPIEITPDGDPEGYLLWKKNIVERCRADGKGMPIILE